SPITFRARGRKVTLDGLLRSACDIYSLNVGNLISRADRRDVVTAAGRANARKVKGLAGGAGNSRDLVTGRPGRARAANGAVESRVVLSCYEPVERRGPGGTG